MTERTAEQLNKLVGIKNPEVKLEVPFQIKPKVELDEVGAVIPGEPHPLDGHEGDI